MLLAACSSSSSGPAPGVPRASLVVLPDTGPTPLDRAFLFKNNQLLQGTVVFNDSQNTVFADFTFPPHSVPFRNDTTLADTSLITVIVSVTPGSFEFTVGPSTLGFNAAGGPTVTVHYAAYSDLSVHSQSPRYTTAAAYSQALELWFEKTTDHWVEGRNSAHSGASLVSSGLEAPGHYLLAAPK